LPEKIKVTNDMADMGGMLSGAAGGAASGAALGPWGAVAGAAVGLGGAIFGASKAKKEKERMEGLINQQQADNRAWFNANAYGDFTQRTDAQNMLRNLREYQIGQSKTAANTAVITGATPEQQAVQKEQAGNVIADTYANLGAMGQQYKDRITDQYLTRKSALENSRLGMMNNNLNNYSNLFNSSISQIGNSVSFLMTSQSGQTSQTPPALQKIGQTQTPQVKVPSVQLPQTLQKLF
jgi:hypothetical protein